MVVRFVGHPPCNTRVEPVPVMTTELDVRFPVTTVSVDPEGMVNVGTSTDPMDVQTPSIHSQLSRGKGDVEVHDTGAIVGIGEGRKGERGGATVGGGRDAVQTDGYKLLHWYTFVSVRSQRLKEDGAVQFDLPSSQKSIAVDANSSCSRTGGPPPVISGMVPLRLVLEACKYWSMDEVLKRLFGSVPVICELADSTRVLIAGANDSWMVRLVSKLPGASKLKMVMGVEPNREAGAISSDPANSAEPTDN